MSALSSAFYPYRFCMHGILESEGKMLQIVQVVRRKWPEKEIVCFPYEILSEDKNFSLKNAVRNTIEDYLQTEKGKDYLKFLRDNSIEGPFTWFDFDQIVPDALCKAHGFLPIRSTRSDLKVDGNEELRKDR